MKKLITYCSFLAFSLLLLLSFNPSKKTVIIDAGHGGNDFGASYEDAMEKEIVQQIANKIQELNTDQTIEIVLTKDNSNNYNTLSERAAMMNNEANTMAISLHVNRTSAKDTEQQGAEIFVQENNETSKILGKKLAEKLNNAVVKCKNLYLLKNVKTPAILVELGYINNKEDRNRLTSEHGQTEIAKQILSFIQEQ